MQVDRFSTTMDPDLGAAVRAAAARSGKTVSAWIAAAASAQLRNDLLAVALDQYEAEFGAFSDEELHAASVALGPKPSAANATDAA